MKVELAFGVYSLYLSNGHVLFFRVPLLPMFLVEVIKRRTFFWGRLSENVKRGYFVRSSRFSIKFLCSGVYFDPIFLEAVIIRQEKLWSLGKNFSLVHARTN